MKCNHVQEQLFRYIEEELSGDASIRIREHLQTCGVCEQKLRLYQETHKALEDFGSAIRAGQVSMTPPPLPAQTQPSLWKKMLNHLKTPVPLWIPSTAGVAALLLFMVIISSPLGPSIMPGKEKGNVNIGVVEPPFAAESMLEFLIVPSLTDPGQLAASIETVETFLLAHRDDLAMHAKLVELYEAQLKLQPLANADGSALAKKLSAERNRFLELLNRKHLTKGDDNVEK